MKWMNSVFSSLSNPPQWITNWIHGWDWGDDREAQRLDTEKALSYAPIWYGCNKIAGHIAQLPIAVYKRLDRGAERERNHPISRLLRRPNAYQTSIVFREQLAINSLLDGNGRAAIVRQGRVPVELIPLHPDCSVTLMLNGEKVHGSRPPEDDRLRKFFPVIPNDNEKSGMIALDDADVLHIPGLSLNGVTGIALRDIAARNLLASINSEKRLASQMENGFSGNLMLEAPTGMFRKEEDAKRFLEEFEARHNSPEKAGKTGLLREGMKANILAMNNRDAEMIDNRRFQRQDAALYLGLESILGDDNSVSYNSLEQKNLAYLMNCLNRWLKRWEEELEYKLLSRRQFDADSHFIRFLTAALLKSDFQSTVASLSTLVTSTIYSRNEAREKLDMNPVPGGDEYANPAITPGNETPEPAPEEPDDDDEEEDTSSIARRALEHRIGHLVGVEANRIRQAAKQATNFVSWVDNFYSAHWERRLADDFEALGLDRHEATLHCEESKRRILEVAGNSTEANLVDNVEKCVASWKLRVSKIGVSINV